MEILQLVFSLIGVIGLIILLFYGLKKLNKRVSVFSGGKMRIIDKVNLGRDGMLLVVSVCGQLMVVGATAQKIEKICDLDMTEEEYIGNSQQAQSISFSQALSTVLGKKQKQNDISEEIKAEENGGEADDNQNH